MGSEDEIEIDGQLVRGRMYPWGIVEVDNPKHSDFSRLRSALLKYVDLYGPYSNLWITDVSTSSSHLTDLKVRAELGE